ncbi:MAG: hypothetical protein M1840_008066 [Geoglossum simile]|nr:MAG: hypothetical protein M1840_008066 [Geoglossum simile]
MAVLADFNPSRSKQDDRRRFKNTLLCVIGDLGKGELIGSFDLLTTLNSSSGVDPSYRDIFTSQHIQELERLRDCIRKDPRFTSKFKDEFTELLRLVKIVDPDEISLERAKINAFPPSSPSFRIEEINRSRGALFQIFSPVVGILYAVSRLCIIAITLSSFRAMPDSVYITSWTRYVPDIQ